MSFIISKKSELAELLKKSSEEALLKARHGYAVTIMERAIKYIMSYLKDYNIDVRKKYRENPIEVLIRIYWIPEKVKEVKEESKEKQK